MDSGSRPRQTAESLINKGKHAGRRIRRAGAAASDKARSGATTASNQVSDKTNAIRRRITGAISWEDSGTDAARRLLAMSLESSKAMGQGTKQTLMLRFKSAYSSTTSRADSAREHAAQFTMGILASDFSLEIDRWLTEVLARPATIYDKAMDAPYVTTYIGGSYHRLFDGGHSLFGAIKAGHTASAEDSFIREATGTVSAIFHDFITRQGLPFFTWDKATFDNVAGVLETNLHIPKSWFYDINTINATELLTASIGAFALILNWNSRDREAFSKTIGSTAIVSVISANPILMVFTLAALAKSFTDARREGNYTEFLEGLTKGGVITGAVIAAGSVVGGPVYVGLIAGICTGIVAHNVVNKLDGVAIREFVMDSFYSATGQAVRNLPQTS
jgi:hypothetical protein